MAIDLATERRVAQPGYDEEVRSTELTGQSVPAPQHIRPVIGTETKGMAGEEALGTDHPAVTFSIGPVIVGGMIVALVSVGFIWVRAEPAIRRLLRNAEEIEIRVPLALPVIGMQIAKDLLAIRSANASEATSPGPARGRDR